MRQGDRFFGDCTGRGVRVAIIDSGVHAAHPHVAGVSGGVRICPDGTLSEDYLDRLGHGTAVAAAIREKAPGTELFSVQVFTEALATRIETLARAIDWAAENRARLINLSLGTSNPEHENALLPALEQARAAGGIIIAAGEEPETRWLPGSLPGVLPALVDWDCPRDEFRAGRRPTGQVVFFASGYPRPIPGVPPERNFKGLSFAVANMTGFAARALELHPNATFEELVDLLAQASCHN